MTNSVIYRSAVIYETTMRVLYGRGYNDRHRTLAGMIPALSSVLDVCCGPATLFSRHLRAKGVRYTGLDINRGFVARVSANGGEGILWNVEEDRPLPRAQYVILQASLYHFLPNPAGVIDRMLEAASEQVLIAEPVRNLADSRIPLVAFLACKLTNPGTQDQPNRFTEASFDAFMDPYRQRGCVLKCGLIAGGREKLYVLSVASFSRL